MGHVERVVEALAERLGDDRELRLAADRLQERVGLEALEPGGRPLPARHAGDEEGAHGRVAEAGGEERRADQAVAEEVVEVLGRHQQRQAAGRRRDLAGGEGEEHAVVHVAGLRDEPEAPPERLPQHDAPGPVDAHAEDRVDHRVPPAQLVAERLHHDGPVVGHAAQQLASLGDPGAERARGRRVEAALARGPRLEPGIVEPLGDVAAEPADQHAEVPRA